MANKSAASTPQPATTLGNPAKLDVRATGNDDVRTLIGLTSKSILQVSLFKATITSLSEAFEDFVMKLFMSYIVRGY